MSNRFIFVGNRRFVLEQMLLEGLNVTTVFVVHGTHLHRDLENGLLSIPNGVVIIKSKVELFGLLKQLKFDTLVSNGCPFILPINELPKARYVNVHPSYLPDLRGKDPTIGAILFERDSGATCHVMDEGIDTGPIIAQVRIPFTRDLDVTTLYQLSFIAEKQAFSLALSQNFKPSSIQTKHSLLISYGRKRADQVISFKEPNELLLQKIKAFNNRTAGCEFKICDNRFRVLSAQVMNNPFLVSYVASFPPLTVILSYEDTIIFHKDGQTLRFYNIEPIDGGVISVGDQLS